MGVSRAPALSQRPEDPSALLPGFDSRTSRGGSLTLEVGPEVTFAEGAEVAAQRLDVPRGSRDGGRQEPQEPEERAPRPAATRRRRRRHPSEAQICQQRGHRGLCLGTTSPGVHRSARGGRGGLGAYNSRRPLRLSHKAPTLPLLGCRTESGLCLGTTIPDVHRSARA